MNERVNIPKMDETSLVLGSWILVRPHSRDQEDKCTDRGGLR